LRTASGLELDLPPDYVLGVFVELFVHLVDSAVDGSQVIVYEFAAHD